MPSQADLVRRRQRSVDDIACELSTTTTRIEELITELELRPANRPFRPDTQFYSYKAFIKIKSRLVPDADGWYNMYQLHQHTGHSERWILSFFTARGIASELRHSPKTGRSGRYFPPEALTLLLCRSTIPPGGNWVTSHAILLLTGTSGNWVDRRLEQPRYRRTHQIRLDDHEVPRRHYPPWVAAELRQRAERFKAIPPSGTYHTKRDICSITGRSPAWVTKRLEQIGARPVRRRDARNRVSDHYPPRIATRLKLMATAEIPAPVDWVTMAQLQDRFGIPAHEIRRRLATIAHATRYGRVTVNGKTELLYNPEAQSGLEVSLRREPYDHLVPAPELVTYLMAFRDDNELTIAELTRMIDYDASKLLDRASIRGSLARRIEALRSMSAAEIAYRRLTPIQRRMFDHSSLKPSA